MRVHRDTQNNNIPMTDNDDDSTFIITSMAVRRCARTQNTNFQQMKRSMKKVCEFDALHRT